MEPERQKARCALPLPSRASEGPWSPMGVTCGLVQLPSRASEGLRSALVAVTCVLVQLPLVLVAYQMEPDRAKARCALPLPSRANGGSRSALVAVTCVRDR